MYIVMDEETVKDLRTRRQEIDEHFGSYALSEAYLNGLIDWDGNELG